MTKKFAIQNKYKIFDDFLLQENKTCINIDVLIFKNLGSFHKDYLLEKLSIKS